MNFPFGCSKMAVVLDEREESVFGKSELRKCSRCSHLNVCSVYRAVAPLINSFEVRKPFDPQSLAVICQEFTLMAIPSEKLNRGSRRQLR